MAKAGFRLPAAHSAIPGFSPGSFHVRPNKSNFVFRSEYIESLEADFAGESYALPRVRKNGRFSEPWCAGGLTNHSGTLAVNNDANLGTGALSFNGGTLEALAAGGRIWCWASTNPGLRLAGTPLGVVG
jgi:hypothetical protein